MTDAIFLLFSALRKPQFYYLLLSGLLCHIFAVFLDALLSQLFKLLSSVLNTVFQMKQSRTKGMFQRFYLGAQGK